jgi:hypothetical protein
MSRVLAPADQEPLGLPLLGAAGVGAVPGELGLHRRGIVVAGYEHLEVGDGELVLATAQEAGSDPCGGWRCRTEIPEFMMAFSNDLVDEDPTIPCHV